MVLVQYYVNFVTKFVVLICNICTHKHFNVYSSFEDIVNSTLIGTYVHVQLLKEQSILAAGDLW